MKLRIDGKLKGIDEKDIVSHGNPPLTFKDVFISCVLSPIEADDEKKKFEKWEIYKKLRDAKEEVNLTIEDLSVLKKCIGKFQPPLILGQCFELIETTDNDEKNK